MIVFDSLGPGLVEGAARLEAGLSAFVSARAPTVQSYAQSNAPWTDRTGNARQGLKARPGSSAGKHWIDLFHSMPYGIYLETRWSGRYEIIVPTILTMGRQLMDEANEIFA